MRLVVVVIGVVLLAAACGDTEPSVYKAAGTAECLRDEGYRVTTDRADLGVVEKGARNGGVLAFKPGNAVRIAFGADSDDALGIQRGYRRFAPKRLRPNIADVMRTQKNAVLLWTVTPPLEEMNTVFACLKG